MNDLVPPHWEGHKLVVEWRNTRLQRIVMEPWRRWANGFSCLCFVVIGIPMAIRMKNADFLTSFFLCFLPILLVYYPLLMFGISRVKAGALPPVSVWAANVVVVLWGMWLMPGGSKLTATKRREQSLHVFSTTTKRTSKSRLRRPTMSFKRMDCHSSKICKNGVAFK